MKPISRSEVLDAAAYERVRSDLRREAIEVKFRRRIQAGPRVTLVFHSRATLLHYLQEGLRAEPAADEAALLREIQIVNEMLPPPGGLSADLYIELGDTEKIREELERFSGLDRGEHLWFDLGDAGRAIARFADLPGGGSRLAAVHPVIFLLGATGTRWFRDPNKPVSFVVEHPGYTARVPVEGPVRGALGADLEDP